MRDVKKTLENTKEIIKDELKKLNKKGELTPAEMDTVFKAVDSIKDICEMCHEDPDGNYSMGAHMYDPNWEYSGTARSPHMYDPNWEYSGTARSPVTGRYISSGMPHGTMRVSYGDNYSGHSIKDRMVARLEPMFDEAKSDYERQLIQNTINRIHAEN